MKALLQNEWQKCLQQACVVRLAAAYQPLDLFMFHEFMHMVKSLIFVEDTDDEWLHWHAFIIININNTKYASNPEIKIQMSKRWMAPILSWHLTAKFYINDNEPYMAGNPGKKAVVNQQWLA